MSGVNRFSSRIERIYVYFSWTGGKGEPRGYNTGLAPAATYGGNNGCGSLFPAVKITKVIVNGKEVNSATEISSPSSSGNVLVFPGKPTPTSKPSTSPLH
jgi:hypothetical protein